MMMWKLLEGVLGTATVGLATLVLWQLVDRLRMRKQFAGILDVEREIAARRKAFDLELAARQIDLEGEIATRRNAIDGEMAMRTAELAHLRGCAMRELVEMMRKTSELEKRHAITLAAHDRLRDELAVFEATAEAVATGLYPPSFTRGAPDDYKRRLRDARELQRAMVHGDQAITYGDSWVVANSRKEGERMQRQYARLLLRAFNGECEAAIAKVRWNNVPRMAERLVQAFGAINRLGAVMQIQLTPQYRDCKLDELRLEYELDQQRRAEHEAHRALRDPAGEAGSAWDEHVLDETTRGLARGSMQIQLAVDVARTADVAGALDGVGPVSAIAAPPSIAGKPAAS